MNVSIHRMLLRFVLLFSSSLLTVHGKEAAQDNDQYAFDEYLNGFGKAAYYADDPMERDKRRFIFQQNLVALHLHNSQA